MKAHLGELLVVEVEKAAWNSSLQDLLECTRPAGVLFRRLESAAAAAEAAVKCAYTLGSAPFLGVEESGAGGLSGILSPLGDAAAMNPSRAATAAELIGAAMDLMGLNFNLAPALDLPESEGGAAANSQPSGESAAARAARLAEAAEAFLGGLERHHILACGRHFPGLPSQQVASRAPAGAARLIAKTMSALWHEDLVPFRKLASRLPAIEISPAIYKAYDYEFPRLACLSDHVVEGLLRVKLAYQGVAVADVAAAARAAGINADEAAIRAVVAGCDLLLVPAGQCERVAASLGRAAEVGHLARERLDHAWRRVRAARRGLRSPKKTPAPAALDKLAREFADFARDLAAEECRHG